MAEREEDNALTNYRARVDAKAQLRGAVKAHAMLEREYPLRIAQKRSTEAERDEHLAQLDALIRTADLLAEFESEFRALARECIDKRNERDAKRSREPRRQAGGRR